MMVSLHSMFRGFAKFSQLQVYLAWLSVHNRRLVEGFSNVWPWSNFTSGHLWWSDCFPFMEGIINNFPRPRSDHLKFFTVMCLHKLFSISILFSLSCTLLLKQDLYMFLHFSRECRFWSNSIAAIWISVGLFALTWNMFFLSLYYW